MQLKELNAVDITETEFNEGTRGKWNEEEIIETAKNISENGNTVKIPIEDFYKSHRTDNGNKEIKYMSYYCRKKLTEAFEKLKIDAEVKTSNGFIKVSIK